MNGRQKSGRHQFELPPENQMGNDSGFEESEELYSVAERPRIFARDKAPGTLMEGNSVLKGPWQWRVTAH